MKKDRSVQWAIGFCAVMVTLFLLLLARGTHLQSVAREKRAMQQAQASASDCVDVLWTGFVNNDIAGQVKNTCSATISEAAIDFQISDAATGQTVYASPTAYVKNLAPGQTANISAYADHAPLDGRIVIMKKELF